MQKAVEWYRKAAEQEYANTQCRLGSMYHDGRGVELSYKTALEWYRKAAAQRHESVKEALRNL